MEADQGSAFQLSPELFVYFAKYLNGEENSLSLALSGAFPGFAALHGQERYYK